MAHDDQATSRRRRMTLGLSVVATALLIATAIVGVGFAGGSISAAQYQYGKVTICHHTHSKKKPWHTITINQNAWKAHQKHGDTLGACTAAQAQAKTKGHGKAKGHGKHDQTPPTTTTTTTTTTSTTDTGSTTHGKGHGKNK